MHPPPQKNQPNYFELKDIECKTSLPIVKKIFHLKFLGQRFFGNFIVKYFLDDSRKKN